MIVTLILPRHWHCPAVLTIFAGWVAIKCFKGEGRGTPPSLLHMAHGTGLRHVPILLLIFVSNLCMVQGTEFASYHVCQPPQQRKIKVRLKIGSLGGELQAPLRTNKVTAPHFMSQKGIWAKLSNLLLIPWNFLFCKLRINLIGLPEYIILWPDHQILTVKMMASFTQQCFSLYKGQSLQRRKYAKPIDREVFDKIDKTKRKKTNDKTESFYLQKKKHHIIAQLIQEALQSVIYRKYWHFK